MSQAEPHAPARPGGRWPRTILDLSLGLALAAAVLVNGDLISGASQPAEAAGPPPECVDLNPI